MTNSSTWDLGRIMTLTMAIPFSSVLSMQLLVPAEVALGLHLARFPDCISDMLEDLLPNRITEFLYDLSQKFTQFYTDCQVIVLHVISELKSSDCPLEAIISTALPFLPGIIFTSGAECLVGSTFKKTLH